MKEWNLFWAQHTWPIFEALRLACSYLIRSSLATWDSCGIFSGTRGVVNKTNLLPDWQSFWWNLGTSFWQMLDNMWSGLGICCQKTFTLPHQFWMRMCKTESLYSHQHKDSQVLKRCSSCRQLLQRWVPTFFWVSQLLMGMASAPCKKVLRYIIQLLSVNFGASDSQTCTRVFPLLPCNAIGDRFLNAVYSGSNFHIWHVSSKSVHDHLRLWEPLLDFTLPDFLCFELVAGWGVSSFTSLEFGRESSCFSLGCVPWQWLFLQTQSTWVTPCPFLDGLPLLPVTLTTL